MENKKIYILVANNEVIKGENYKTSLVWYDNIEKAELGAMRLSIEIKTDVSVYEAKSIFRYKPISEKEEL